MQRKEDKNQLMKLDDRRFLYQLMIRQLQDDGYTKVAALMSQATMVPALSADALEPNRLATLVEYGMNAEKDRKATGRMDDHEPKLANGVDFDAEQNVPNIFRPFFAMTTRFFTSHKNSCRIAKFSRDGKLVASGSADTSIKLLEVEKMKNYVHKANQGSDVDEGRPVFRTFYDHSQVCF
eukprot:TRINITY_DN728_c0_g1_i1.p2 TRINITY_DN728_c0_g1~~TRINITY_DN728_c0_g1_i1.p2  ORF type:complete len:201 (-),score=51.55 TRINITY_DN728_c0_g1_i1:905-1444(-)